MQTIPLSFVTIVTFCVWMLGRSRFFYISRLLGKTLTGVLKFSYVCNVK